MRYAPLPHGIPAASVLGIGCAAMMGSLGRRESLAALHAAADAGINFFDTARSYGYGQSEALLGEFLAGRRAESVICTKFGILPPPGGWKQRLKPLARAALRLFPGLRGAARKHAGQMMSAGHFTVPALRASLETSLRALHTDYVDLLLMHAAPASVLAQQDLLEELARLVDEGKVRMAGISGEPEVVAQAFAAHLPVLETAQFAVNLGTLGLLDTAKPQRMFAVANHPFGGALGVAGTRARIVALGHAPDLEDGLREKLAAGDPRLLPDVLLNIILQGMDAVIPAMGRPEHVRMNVDVVSASRFSAEELGRLRRALAAGNETGEPLD